MVDFTKPRTEYYYLQGKSKWCRIVTPDASFGDPKWKITLYPDVASMEKIRALKAKGLRNEIYQDEDGESMVFSRKTQMQRGGKMIGLAPPVVLEADGRTPFPNTTHIGNGSDVTIKVAVYNFTYANKPGIAARLESIRVDNLVPFIPQNNFTPSEEKAIKGLADQPKQAEPSF